MYPYVSQDGKGMIGQTQVNQNSVLLSGLRHPQFFKNQFGPLGRLALGATFQIYANLAGGLGLSLSDRLYDLIPFLLS